MVNKSRALEEEKRGVKRIFTSVSLSPADRNLFIVERTLGLTKSTILMRFSVNFLSESKVD